MKKLTLNILLIFYMSGFVFGQTTQPPRTTDLPETKETPLNAAAKNQSAEEAASEILEKHVEAIGGRAAFASIKTLDIETERQVLGRSIKTAAHR